MLTYFSGRFQKSSFWYVGILSNPILNSPSILGLYPATTNPPVLNSPFFSSENSPDDTYVSSAGQLCQPKMGGYSAFSFFTASKKLSYSFSDRLFTNAIHTAKAGSRRNSKYFGVPAAVGLIAVWLVNPHEIFFTGCSFLRNSQPS